VDADQVQHMMEQVHEHRPGKLRWSKAVQQESANPELVAARNIEEGSKVWLDVWNIKTTRPNCKMD
jgi:hypothetical protein